MKVVIFGGTGQLGKLLSRSFAAAGHETVVVARSTAALVRGVRFVAWDGRTLGAWREEVDGADVVINLAGRSVDCRYTEANLREMLLSRTESTRVVGEAIAASRRPPKTWLQMSTATIYAHAIDREQDERTGELGGSEPGVPAYWKRSVEIAQAWEAELERANTPATRKVALRTSMVMCADPGGVFDVLSRLVRFGLGGAAAGGRQYVSWIHEDDFVRAVWFIVEHAELSGAINVAGPRPVPHRDFMRGLRSAWGRRVALPASRWMLQLGAFFLRTDAELLLKSRRVVPGRLLDAGFRFAFPEWSTAAIDLVARARADREVRRSSAINRGRVGEPVSALAASLRSAVHRERG